ncbi:MAG: ATP-binding cassette domain-containing protein, partial [Panacagrimonas sp.]
GGLPSIGTLGPAGLGLEWLAYRGSESSAGFGWNVWQGWYGIRSFIEKMVEIKMLRLQGERLADIVLTEPEASPSAASDKTLAPVIEVVNLHYRYADQEPWVLHGVNLKIGAGESVAIVGPSGCGKTTLINVMLGIRNPSEGDVLIGGVSVKQIGADSLRRMVGTVMQDDSLFAGSIADNICFFDTHADQARIEECARMAAIDGEIGAMPMGYNTFIGDMGSALSGGQKQRILLARALYKQPKILFLDEATSHLDIARETLVNDSIRSLKITRVIVAHRPETIASADRVIELAGGTVASDRPVENPAGGRT